MTQAKKIKSEDHPIIVSIDWATEKHDIRIEKHGVIRQFEISTDITELFTILSELVKENNDRPIPVVYEKGRHFLHKTLMAFPKEILLFPIHPETASRYRETMHPSRVKTDPIDCKSLMEYWRRHSDILTVHTKEGCDLLDRLSRQRRKYVDCITSYSQQLRALLGQYFPQSKYLISGAITGKMSLAFLRKFPSPQRLIKTSDKVLKNFYSKHHARAKKLDGRLSIKAELIAVVVDEQELDLYELDLEALLDQVEKTQEIVARYDKKIAEYFQTSKYQEIVESFPGAGPALAPRVGAFLEKHAHKLETSAQFQKLAAVAPIENSSGKKKIIKKRYLCDKFDLQTFTEWAGSSIKTKGWAKDYYDRRKSRGDQHFIILRAIAFKWIRILHSCIKNDTLYNPVTHFENCTKRMKKIA